MRPFLCGFALLLLVSGCGGGAAATGDAKSAGNGDSGSRESAGSDSDAESDSGESAAATENSKAKGPSCDDGTCSMCGSSICPTGWYCDEKASACSWLTECAEKPTCGCVTRVLGSACKCHEEAGGLKVACE
jgi:hypothetical protein